MFSERINELMIEKSKVLHQCQQASITVTEESDIESVSHAIVEFCSSFRWGFEHSSLSEKKELLRRSIWRIVVDGGARIAECYVRRFPIVVGLPERMIWELEKHATATDLRLPLCNEKVPGTGKTLWLQRYFGVSGCYCRIPVSDGESSTPKLRAISRLPTPRCQWRITSHTSMILISW